MSTRATRLPSQFRKTTAELQESVRKYKNKKIEIDGIMFDSQREGKRYQELKLLEQAGKITRLELQPRWKFAFGGKPVLIRSEGFPNGRQASFKADFRYWDVEKDCEIVEDCKSPATRTQAYTLRKAMLECMCGWIRVVEV